MMAARFRSVYWVAIALVPALGCYLVTHGVAAERAELAKVERQIVHGRLAIRSLETELGTRGSMAQLERWNAETLDLVAPGADHYVSGEVLLASLRGAPAASVVPAIAKPAAPAPMREAAFAPPAAPQPAEQPMLRQANYIKPAAGEARPAPRKVALAEAGPLDDSVLADLGRLASQERGSARR